MTRGPDGLSRRAFLGIAAAGAMVANPRVSRANDVAPVTFVFVHGSWQGGWCWQRVRRLLDGLSHATFTPTLTGMGERYHLVNPSIDVDLHVRDVREMISFENLRNIVLVGHSYGGLVVTALAEQISDRIKHIVYLDGLIPDDGQSHMDIVPGFKDATLAAAKQRGGGWLIPPWSAAQLGVTDPRDAAWMEERLRPQPLGTWQQPIRVRSAEAARIRKSFIWCTQFTLRAMAEKARKAGWDVQELPTGHEAMVTMPKQLSQMLVAYARAS